jgi:prepilin-type N-terminal cleavage/methylation domain-containing protein
MKNIILKIKHLIHLASPRRSTAKAGFTLVELLVSLALFTVVVVAAVGSLYTINQASVKVNAMRTVLDNLNFATESMNRTIRTGSDLVCGGTLTGSYSSDGKYTGGSPNCPFGSSGGSPLLSLNSTLGQDTGGLQYQYNHVNHDIEKCVDTNGSLSNCVALTAPEVNVTSLTFYVDGATLSDNKQPSVIMMIQGVATAADGTQPFAIQTYISQRAAE